MSNKKILIISAVFPPEPVVSATLSRDLAEELSKGHQVIVLCPRPTRPHNFKFMEISTSENYKIHRLDSFTCSASNLKGRLLESYSFGKHCVRFIKNHFTGIDCIYINVWPIFAPYIITRTAKKLKIPIIVHIQDIYPESLLTKLRFGKKIISKLLLPFDKFVLEKATTIIAISENMKQILIKDRKLQPDKISVISNWQNEDEFIRFHDSNNRFEQENKPFTFMYLGNNGPLAGVDFLIDAFVKAEISNSQLIIAGSGSKTEDCKASTISYGATNIKFINVPEGKVPEIQDLADAMLLPVKKHGAMSSIPSKLPAYMFSSKPIIGSVDLESDTAKTIKDADCGIVVEPENKALLIEAMQKMAAVNKADLALMGKSGYNFALKFFSKQKNLDKLIALFESS